MAEADSFAELVRRVREGDSRARIQDSRAQAGTSRSGPGICDLESVIRDRGRLDPARAAPALGFGGASGGRPELRRSLESRADRAPETLGANEPARPSAEDLAKSVAAQADRHLKASPDVAAALGDLNAEIARLEA